VGGGWRLFGWWLANTKHKLIEIHGNFDWQGDGARLIGLFNRVMTKSTNVPADSA